MLYKILPVEHNKQSTCTVTTSISSRVIISHCRLVTTSMFSSLLTAVNIELKLFIYLFDSIECSGQIDLMIVVDGSYSVTSQNFQLIKKWIKDIAKGFHIEDGIVQIGVVRHSSENK